MDGVVKQLLLHNQSCQCSTHTVENHFITFTCAVITLQHVTITAVTVERTISVDTLMLTSSIGYSTLINI